MDSGELEQGLLGIDMADNLGLHLSKTFLRQRYVMQKRTPEAIAKECGVSVVIIYKQLKKFELRR
jgi:hypothetical protein